MSIPYPSKPWSDGQTFSYTLTDGSTGVGTYSSSKNAWTFSGTTTSTNVVTSINAGTGISVNQSTGDVTITATGGGGGGATAIDDLTDVDTSTVAPTNGQALVWDSTASQWEPGTVSGGGSVTSVAGKTGAVTLVKADITDFSDADYATAAQGTTADTALQPTDSINALADVDTSTVAPTNGQALVWDSTASQWEPGTVSGGGSVASIDDIGDVDTTTVAPTNGQALVWDSTAQQWEPGTVSGGGGATVLNDLTDVTIDANLLAKDQGLVYDGTEWVVGSPPVIVEGHNQTGGVLSKGTPVYVSGTHSSGKPLLTAADADGAGTYPAIGLVDADIANGADGYVMLSGILTNVNTSTYSSGDALYLSTTAGVLTSTRPTAATEKVQKVGIVTRVHAVSGSILIIGAGRTNDINNELVALIGSGDRNAVDLGTFTGTTISDNTDIKSALQELETAVETPTNVADLGDYELRPAAGTTSVLRNANISQTNNVSSGNVGLGIISSGYTFWSFGPEGEGQGTILDYLRNVASFPIDVDIQGNTFSVTEAVYQTGTGNGSSLRLLHPSFTNATQVGGTGLWSLALTSAPTTPVADGDVLQYNATDTAWKPGPLSFPVSSVNTQTGVVSLGIEDMDDFAFTPSGGMPYNTWSTDNTPTAGQWHINTNFLYLPRVDSNGADQTTNLEALDGTTTLTITENGTDYDIPNATIASNELGSGNDRILIRSGASPGGVIATIAGQVSQVGMEATSSSFTLATLPLADGDILEYNATDSKFKPVQLSDVAPVSSVNTLTGAVSLGIEDMDDFALNPGAFPYWATKTTNSTPAAGEWFANGSNVMRANPVDSNGTDWSTEMAALGTTGTFWYSTDGTNWTQTTNSSGFNNLPTWFQFGLAPFNVGTHTGGIYISFSDPSSVAGAPLADGDLLQYVSADSKFKPVQFDTLFNLASLTSLP